MNLGKYSIISFVLSIWALACSGQKFSLGNCPTTLQSVITPNPLALANLVGVWREYARSKAPQQHAWRCTTYTVTAVTANVRYTVTIGGRKKITSTPLRTAGTIDVSGANGNNAAVTTVLTFRLTDGLTTKSLRYFILGLDAANPTFLVLYACSDLSIGKLESAILLTKTGVTDANVVAALQILAQNGFPSNSLYFNFNPDCLV